MINILENERLSHLNHSCAHLLAQAITHLYPNAKFWVGPAIKEGFYYDIDLGENVITEEDLPKIEREMKKCSKSAKNIIRSEGTAKLSTEGTKITREDLLPGDNLVRPGYDSHVMMFLEWYDDNKIKVIHENGAVNNISIGTYDAYYPYYRRIITS